MDGGQICEISTAEIIVGCRSAVKSFPEKLNNKTLLLVFPKCGVFPGSKLDQNLCVNVTAVHISCALNSLTTC